MPGTVQALKDKAQEDKYINTVCVFLSAYNVYTIFFIYIYIYTHRHTRCIQYYLYINTMHTQYCVYIQCVYIYKHVIYAHNIL